MIISLQGQVELKTEKFVVLNVSGIGYKVFCSEKTLGKIPAIGQNIKVYTYLSIKETGWELFGFFTFEELELFELLVVIPGIGPKTAMNILSVASVQDLEEAIVLGDETILGKVSGLSQKMAGKIVLELKTKVKKISKSKTEASKVVGDIEVIDALVSLGYRISDAREALRQLPETIKGVENRVKECLRRLGKR